MDSMGTHTKSFVPLFHFPPFVSCDAGGGDGRSLGAAAASRRGSAWSTFSEIDDDGGRTRWGSGQGLGLGQRQGQGGGLGQSEVESDTSDAIVPHLGAHLAELISISEGNPEYLPHMPHCVNLGKYTLLTNSLRIIDTLQQLR